ncbi:Hypothetical protein PHPALM_10294 [Phytophthora palmivora]|uniref:Uncharacterized protein n=1 Tax=Phytophthora palmivora TaxID=4796 RepID=A0A2P4Y531_9STRA|nr:Hypothetical protein PHPALM_10294 [Phytophthora palmivora]
MAEVSGVPVEAQSAGKLTDGMIGVGCGGLVAAAATALATCLELPSSTSNAQTLTLSQFFACAIVQCLTSLSLPLALLLSDLCLGPIAQILTSKLLSLPVLCTQTIACLAV